MNIRLTPAETSIEFAIDNARERLHYLTGKDHLAVLKEYDEWLSLPSFEEEVLVIHSKLN